jgi:ferric-dicitrate binding protein FerR (iron transport regulator)
MKSIVRGRALAAVSLTLCLLATQALAASTAPAGARSRLLGEMTSFGQVSVNGEDAMSGATVFPGSRLATAKESGAIINLAELGRVRLAAETASLLNFGEQSLEGSLDSGVITVSKSEGVAAVFSTSAAQVVAAGPAAVFTVTVKGGSTVVKTESGSVELRDGKTTKVIGAGQEGSAGTPPKKDDDDNDKKKGGLFWLGVAGFTGEVVGAIIWALSDNDHGNNGSTTPIEIVPSPSR